MEITCRVSLLSLLQEDAFRILRMAKYSGRYMLFLRKLFVSLQTLDPHFLVFMSVQESSLKVSHIPFRRISRPCNMTLSLRRRVMGSAHVLTEGKLGDV